MKEEIATVFGYTLIDDNGKFEVKCKEGLPVIEIDADDKPYVSGFTKLDGSAESMKRALDILSAVKVMCMFETAIKSWKELD